MVRGVVKFLLLVCNWTLSSFILKSKGMGSCTVSALEMKHFPVERTFLADNLLVFPSMNFICKGSCMTETTTVLQMSLSDQILLC